MQFIDREDEQERLHRALDSDKPEFVVLYGRRRLGKSTLIRRVLKKNDVYYEASRKEKGIQIDMLAHTIANVYPGFDGPEYPDWQDIILAFNYRCEPNSTLVLDEFPSWYRKILHCHLFFRSFLTVELSVARGYDATSSSADPLNG